MRLRIECTVPDDWRDQTSTAGILEGPYNDITAALLDLGAEDIDTQDATEEAAKLDAMQATLDEAVAAGDLETTGTGDDGRPLYTMTEQGKAKVRAMGGGS